MGVIKLTLFSVSGEGSNEDKQSSLAFIQLEKQNERLKEALIRWVYLVCQSVSNLYFSLRDMSQETEQEQRRHISELERDITNIDDLQGLQLGTFVYTWF